MDRKISHLNMIQDIITRMGNNSFALKGWSVAIVIAICGFVVDNKEQMAIITLIPLIIFWILDSYYLLLEKKYRLLYELVRKKEEKEIDFNMNFNEIKLSITEAKKINLINIMFSKTMIFYFAMIIVTMIINFRR